MLTSRLAATAVCLSVAVGLVTWETSAQAAPVFAGRNGEYRIDLEYKTADLFAGNRNAIVDVTISWEAKQPDLRLVRALSDDGFISVKVSVLGSESPSTNFVSRRYRVALVIQPKAEPRSHALRFELEGEKRVGPLSAEVNIPVGVVHDGQLSALLDKQIDGGLFSGEQTVVINLLNGFPEYKIYVERLEISPIPNYLIQLAGVRGATVSGGVARFDPPLEVGSAQRIDLPVTLSFRTPNLSDAILGVKDPAVSFAFTYHDGMGRQVSDLRLSRALGVPISVVCAVLAVAIGLILGTLISAFLGGAVSTKQTAGSLIAGLLIILAVLMGRLQFSIFNSSWNYKSAAALLLLSAVVAFSQPLMPLLRRFFQMNDEGPRPPSPAVIPVIPLLLGAGALLTSPLSSRAQSGKTTQTGGAKRTPARPARGPAVTVKQTGPDAAQAVAVSPRVSPASASLQRGRFFLPSAEGADTAKRAFREVASGGTESEVEEAEYSLGLIPHRQFYILKERTGARDWSLLNQAEANYLRARVRSSSATGWRWLSDAAFRLALVQMERGAVAQAKTAIEALKAAGQKDRVVQVDQVVWTALPGATIGREFSAESLAALLTRTTSVSDVVSALSDWKALDRPLAKPPLVSVVTPQAKAVKVGQNKNGPLYDFSLSLQVPEDRRGEIAKVVYHLNHPTFSQKNYEGTDPAREFRAGYRGWGALSQVGITIERRDGAEETMEFDMLAALNWQ